MFTLECSKIVCNQILTVILCSLLRRAFQECEEGASHLSWILEEQAAHMQVQLKSGFLAGWHRFYVTSQMKMLKIQSKDARETPQVFVNLPDELSGTISENLVEIIVQFVSASQTVWVNIKSFNFREVSCIILSTFCNLEAWS